MQKEGVAWSLKGCKSVDGIIPLISSIKVMGILSEEATLLFLSPFEVGSTLKGQKFLPLTLVHSERPKLHAILAFLSAIGLRVDPTSKWYLIQRSKLEFMLVYIKSFSENRQGAFIRTEAFIRR